ncbi:MAG: hypothetical protein HPY59_09645 [Anaerolineae bacterium]|nr:hypothetical protein [Anaerolineae bacterium]
MNRSRLWIALLVLIAPIIGRALWFYRGAYQPPQTIATPDYLSITLPEAVISTPFPEKSNKPAQAIKNQARVLIDINHDNLYTTTELQPLFDNIAQFGGIAQLTDYNQTLEETLRSVDSYVVLAPTLPFLVEELTAIHRFVERGGKLLVIADPTRDMSMYGYVFGDTASYLQSVAIVNALVEPYGMTFVEDYLYNLRENEANFRNILLDDFDKNDDLTQDIEKAVFYGTHSLETSQKTLILASNTTLSSRTDEPGEYPVAASSAQGRVVALGDFTFMTNPYYKIWDNQQLVKNIAEFLAGDKRSRTIRDFPYLFNQQTGFWVEKDAVITQDKLAMFSLLQSTLENLNIKLALVERPVKGYDLLVVEKFSQYQKLEDFLEPFDLKFEDIPTENEAEEENGEEITPTLSEPDLDPEKPTPSPQEEESQTTPTPESAESEDAGSLFSFLEDNIEEEKNGGKITVPGLGKLSPNGIGLILFDQQEDRNTLILLANNKEALLDLTSYFTTGSLSNCAFYKDIAICAVTKDSDSESSSNFDSFDFTDSNSGY